MALSYSSLLRTLEDSRAQLRDVVVPERGEDRMTWLRTRRAAESQAADAACEEFALTRQWPPIRTDSIVAQIHLRIGSATDLCRSLQAHGLPRDVTEREVLRSLLLEYWHQQVAVVLRGTPEAVGSGSGGGLGPSGHFPTPGFNLTVAE